MSSSQSGFASVADAIAALEAETEPMALTRFVEPMRRVVVAVNAAARASATAPAPGDQPDRRRDRDISADIEVEYFYRQLVERGHTRQVLSIGGLLLELAANRIYIDGDDRVYAFITPKRREPAKSG